MAQKIISPNRMELMRLKKELKTARRGHKMLKDKRDELMRQFLDLVRENQKLRLIVNQKLKFASKGMSLASALMDPPVLKAALMVGGEDRYIKVDYRSVMGVTVPQFAERNSVEADDETDTRSQTDAGDISSNEEKQTFLAKIPYDFSTTHEALDKSVEALGVALNPLLRLASIEKTVQLLADEIEKTRRRVNSLEYVKIPELTKAIRSITLKMEENERGNLTRLMKVKDMIIERNRKNQQ